MKQLNTAQLLGQQNSHISWLSDNVGIHHDMVKAYRLMQAAAKADGIDLHIASGFRPFERQLAIWNNKFTGVTAVKDQQGNKIDLALLPDQDKVKAILQYSALPGASRHHWGTDIDVYAPNLLSPGQSLQLEPWEYELNGPFYPLTVWLNKHGADFGFYLPYNRYRGGVAAEPWHLSYLPLAKDSQNKLSLEVLKECLQTSELQGKATVLAEIDNIYKNFIMNINDLDDC
jgi:LAS superfamily LD-carboxypeptidase LdcB